MSKRKPKFEYEKSFSYKFNKWMDTGHDLFTEDMESKPQHVKKLSKATITERMSEKMSRRELVFDTKNNRILRIFNKFYYVTAIIFCLFLLALLLYNVSYLPRLSNPGNAVNNEVVKRYVEKGIEETGAVNVVTGMILDYRAFDTLGESNVLFTATVTVLILLQIIDKSKKRDENMIFEPHDDEILKLTASVLVPIIIIFGIYIILNGHLSPGGGFSGGAIIGAGLILYQNAYGFEKAGRIFNEKTYKTISTAALSTYCLCKMYSFFMGANHLDSHIPLGTPGNILSSGLIFVLNICVGMVVACTMYTFYVMFRRGDF